MSEFPDSKYLSFELDDHYSGKTERVVITSKTRLVILGEIRWFGAWRQYAFFPEPHTVWNPECMDDIQACIAILKQRRDAAPKTPQSVHMSDKPKIEFDTCKCGKEKFKVSDECIECVHESMRKLVPRVDGKVSSEEFNPYDHEAE